MVHPYLSIVVVVRNDNYGGDFTHRFQVSLDSLSKHVIESKVPIELVLVNYNPINEEPSFIDLISWPEPNEFLAIRLIDVPPDAHSHFMNDGIDRMKLPVMEFFAKNIGIRRASAPYILSTNADIVFDFRFFNWLKSRPLRDDCYYRSDRYDFEKIPSEVILKQVPGNKIWKIYTRLGLFVRKKWKPYWLFRFLAFIYAWWGRGYSIVFSPFKFLEKYRRFVPYVPPNELFLLRYHFHACGDFTLSAKENWFKLRGYAEDTYSAMHTDSLFLISCISYGLKEVILPYPVYHQMHTNTFEHNSINYYNDIMFKRLVSSSAFLNKKSQTLIVNSKDWGMENVELFEIRIV